MSTLNRMFGLAKKALETKTTGSTGSGGPAAGQGSDWRSMVRSAADAITGEGGGQRPQSDPSAAPPASPPAPGADLSDTDRRAIARYDYLVRTAEPDQLEQVHREAFERLTPHQRAQLTATMRSELPESERPRTDAPQDLARSATRLGALDPRKLTRLLSRSGGSGGGSGRGLAIGAAGGLLGVVAGGAIATAVGGSLLQDAIGSGIDVDSLTEGLEMDLGGVTEGIEGFGGDLSGAADGLGGSVSDAGDRVSGFGEGLSNVNLGDLFGR
ncbi:cation-transporting ATPase [Brachybacterium sp. FME24]|uniref:cation-transporting ATPase n=1 Tax=Brachybacterium sp. FME24 TaxID=2742605 RepID=UPI00186803BA|nr:cation-transporting ATPase [Brachybacterium sp. FME24]